MARGKHAARSIKRANEAAVAHIDRLTDQLTEAKIKARRYEAAAVRLPAVEQEVARLRDIANGEMNPARDDLMALRDEVAIERRTNREDKNKLRKYVARMISVAWNDDADGYGGLFTIEQWDELATLLHVGTRDLLDDARGMPRAFREGSLRFQQNVVQDRHNVMKAVSRAELVRDAASTWLADRTEDNHRELVTACGTLASRYHRWFQEELDQPLQAVEAQGGPA